MKRRFILPVSSFLFLILFSCSSKHGELDNKILIPIEKVMNKRAREVEDILGTPDTDYNIQIVDKKIFAQRYRKHNIEIRYPGSTATEVVVYGPHDLPFDAKALKAFDIRTDAPPSEYIPRQLIRWYTVEDFETITFYDPELDSLKNVTNYKIFFKAQK